MRIESSAIFSAVDSSLSQTSTAQQIFSGFMWCLTIAPVAAGVAGALKAQVSNDPSGESYPYLVASGSWVDLPLATVTLAGAVSLIQATNAGYRWLRFVWTPTGGSTGTFSAQFNAKGV